jgi:hypothetical protein
VTTVRVIAEYVETWDGGHGYPGFCVCRVVEEDGKPVRVERGKPIYLREHPEMKDWWTVYQLAASNMRSLAWWKDKRKKKAA